MIRCLWFAFIIGRLMRIWEVNILIGLLVVVLFSILVGTEDRRILQEENP